MIGAKKASGPSFFTVIAKMQAMTDLSWYWPLMQYLASLVIDRSDFGPPIGSQLRPGVFASLHMRNWEVASWAGQICDVRFAGVYQQVRNPYIERLLLSNRLPFYPGGLHAKGAKAVRKLIGALDNGISVCMMADLRDLRGVSVPFFGREAPSTPFPATLARSHDKPLLAARVLRRAPGRFEIEVVEIAVPRTANRTDDIRQATAALHRQFEAWIRADPEQWMWAHRRFER